MISKKTIRISNKIVEMSKGLSENLTVTPIPEKNDKIEVMVSLVNPLKNITFPIVSIQYTIENGLVTGHLKSIDQAYKLNMTKLKFTRNTELTLSDFQEHIKTAESFAEIESPN